MDYKIKLEYKGIGRQATMARQKAIQAQKKAESGGEGAKSSININKQLISSIQKLIDSNKKLSEAIKGAGGGGRRGGGGGGGEGGAFGGGAGLGRVGASLPLGIGVTIAAAGFAIQKAGQIGQAFMDLSSKQLRTVGIGGFRKGRGIYEGSELGAGMAAYAKGTGRFATPDRIGVGQKNIQNALAIGTKFGMSPEQILGQAGTFQRAGGNINQAAGYAAGRGIEADMPILLSGMAGIMEDAIRSGIDATDMAKNLGRGLTDLANETPTKSVEAAMSIVRSFQGVKTSVAGGKMAGFENLMAAQAGRDILMEKLSDPNYRKQLVEQKQISTAQAAAMESAGIGNGKKSFQELQKTIGVAGAQGLLQNTVAQSNTPDLLMRMFQNIQSKMGAGVEAKQQFKVMAQSMGFSSTPQQMDTLWNLAEKGAPKSEFVKQVQEMGMKDIKTGAKKIEAGPAGIGAQKMIEMQNLVLKHGEGLAEASLKMQKALISLTDEGIKKVSSGLKTMARELGFSSNFSDK